MMRMGYRSGFRWGSRYGSRCGCTERGCTLIELIFIIGLLTLLMTVMTLIVHRKLHSARTAYTDKLLASGAEFLRAQLPPQPRFASRFQSTPPPSCSQLLRWYRAVQPRVLIRTDAWQSRVYVGCVQGEQTPRLALYSSGPDRRPGTQDDLCRPLYPELGGCAVLLRPSPVLKTAQAPPPAWWRYGLAGIAVSLTMLVLWRRAARLIPAPAPVE